MPQNHQASLLYATDLPTHWCLASPTEGLTLFRLDGLLLKPYARYQDEAGRTVIAPMALVHPTSFRIHPLHATELLPALAEADMRYPMPSWATELNTVPDLVRLNA